MITNYFQPLDDNYKDTHSDPKWKKINTNEADNLEYININFHEDKVVKFVSNVKINNLHLIQADNTYSKHNCKYCSETKLYSTNKCPTSKYYCNKCKIFLCIDCFYNYQEKKFNS